MQKPRRNSKEGKDQEREALHPTITQDPQKQVVIMLTMFKPAYEANTSSNCDVIDNMVAMVM